MPQSIHKIKYECIDAEVIQNTALYTRGGSGPSKMDGDGWRRILTPVSEFLFNKVAGLKSSESSS